MRINWDPGSNVAAQAEMLEKNSSKSQRALLDAAQQFEGLFLNMLLTEMRRTVPDSDLLGNRQAEKLFQSMLDQEMAGSFAKTQTMGLARLIYEQMSRYVSEQD